MFTRQRQTDTKHHVINSNCLFEQNVFQENHFSNIVRQQTKWKRISNLYMSIKSTTMKRNETADRQSMEELENEKYRKTYYIPTSLRSRITVRKYKNYKKMEEWKRVKEVVIYGCEVCTIYALLDLQHFEKDNNTTLLDTFYIAGYNIYSAQCCIPLEIMNFNGASPYDTHTHTITTTIT